MENHRGFAITLARVLKATIPVLLLVSCVSVDINQKRIEKSDDAIYTPPQAPFEQFEASHVDTAWQNPKTGSSISYLSECNDPSKPSLKNVVKGITSGLRDISKRQQDVIDFKGQRGIRSVILTRVGKAPSKIEILTFKKSECLYTLTFVSLKKYYRKDLKVFNQFLKGFRVE